MGEEVETTNVEITQVHAGLRENFSKLPETSQEAMAREFQIAEILQNGTWADAVEDGGPFSENWDSKAAIEEMKAWIESDEPSAYENAAATNPNRPAFDTTIYNSETQTSPTRDPFSAPFIYDEEAEAWLEEVERAKAELATQEPTSFAQNEPVASAELGATASQVETSVSATEARHVEIMQARMEEMGYEGSPLRPATDDKGNNLSIAELIQKGNDERRANEASAEGTGGIHQDTSSLVASAEERAALERMENEPGINVADRIKNEFGVDINPDFSGIVIDEGGAIPQSQTPEQSELAAAAPDFTTETVYDNSFNDGIRAKLDQISTRESYGIDSLGDGDSPEQNELAARLGQSTTYSGDPEVGASAVESLQDRIAQTQALYEQLKAMTPEGRAEFQQANVGDTFEVDVDPQYNPGSMNI